MAACCLNWKDPVFYGVSGCSGTQRWFFITRNFCNGSLLFVDYTERRFFLTSKFCSDKGNILVLNFVPPLLIKEQTLSNIEKLCRG